MNEAELVLTHVLNCDRLSLYLHKEDCLDEDKSAQISAILKRRIAGEPLQYILGSVEFMGYKFTVDSRALIPRPETEILVSSALEKLKLLGKNLQPKILDLGTGSGCIAISLAHLLPTAVIWATDISASALALARTNALAHSVKINFLKSDIFSALEKSQNKFDLIISNPPYIATADFKNLARELSFEPVLALTAGGDGLDYYRRIIAGAGTYLKADGLLALEVGANQADKICTLCAQQNLKIIAVVKDYNQIQRVVLAQQGKV